MRCLPYFIFFILLTGCASNSEDMKKSVFFAEVFPLTQFSQFADEYSYIAPRVDFTKYTEIYVAPVVVYDDKDGLQMTKLMKDQIQENYRLQLMLIMRKKGLNVVYTPVLDGIELNAAVTSVRIENDGFEISDLLWPSFGDDDTSRSSDASANLNQRHIEIRGEAFLWDTRGKVTVGQFVSVKKGPTSAGDNNEITYNEVRPVIEQWTERAGFWACTLFKK